MRPFAQHIPMVFHNLKHYDAHHLISFIGGVTNVETVDYVNKYGKSKSRQVGRYLSDPKQHGIVHQFDMEVVSLYQQFGVSKCLSLSREIGEEHTTGGFGVH